MKGYIVDVKLHLSVYVEADNEQDATSQVVDELEWPGEMLDEKYTVECVYEEV